MEKSVICPDCNVEMERGYIPDTMAGDWQQPVWCEGLPTLGSLFGMGHKASKLHTVMGFRCASCGLLRFYAP